MNRKTCIVAEGGGLRASYGVGVVRALIEKFHITSVDIAVATSGSAGTLAYYVAQQFDSLVNIWTNLLTTWRFLSLRNLLLGNSVLNIDYLIDVVFKQQDKLDVETLKRQPTELFIPVTNYRTGEAQYFSNYDDVDFFEVLRATKAAEISYGRPVEIAGQEYVDGALSAPIGITKAIDAGATDIIVISPNPKGFIRSRSIMERFTTGLFARRFPKSLRQTIEEHPETYNLNLDIIKREIEMNERHVVLIQPESKIATGTLGNSREKLMLTIEQGYADACRHEELNSFGK
ncbi:MAG: patatin family protein [Candidatus Hydrogenedentota bacterium]|nr:MAG: patatin family protein [Candidatus Hydrogenedentota bacterium]